MKTLFDSDRLTLSDSIRLTVESLQEHSPSYKHWAIAFSGGKDSSALATLIPHLLDIGAIEPPESLTVLYADTRMELPPLQISAEAILHSVRKLGHDARTVLPALDDRFFVYMLGRGVPPPKNRFRWCTPQLKIEPMHGALQELRDRHGKLLMLTGVRLGESAARDQRISLSCSKDGAECGQGWFQEATPASVADTLAPILHWRVCHTWEWLTDHAPHKGFPTARLIADAYGGSAEVETLAELNARTGCVACPLASRDQALNRLIQTKHWGYLAPLKQLRDLWLELAAHRNRLRKSNDERRADGSMVSNPGRIGPLKMEARRYGLEFVLAMQGHVNAAARTLGRPEICLINEEERLRILELIDANTWPQRWTGDEISGDEDLPDMYPDGTIQNILFGN